MLHRFGCPPLGVDGMTPMAGGASRWSSLLILWASASVSVSLLSDDESADESEEVFYKIRPVVCYYDLSSLIGSPRHRSQMNLSSLSIRTSDH